MAQRPNRLLDSITVIGVALQVAAGATATALGAGSGASFRVSSSGASTAAHPSDAARPDAPDAKGRAALQAALIHLAAKLCNTAPLRHLRHQLVTLQRRAAAASRNARQLSPTPSSVAATAPSTIIGLLSFLTAPAQPAARDAAISLLLQVDPRDIWALQRRDIAAVAARPSARVVLGALSCGGACVDELVYEADDHAALDALNDAGAAAAASSGDQSPLCVLRLRALPSERGCAASSPADGHNGNAAASTVTAGPLRCVPMW